MLDLATAPARPDTDITREQLEVGWWDIARAGKWNGSSGGVPIEVTLAQSDIEAMAADYNRDVQAAPLTIEHVRSGPAHGWVSALRVSGDKLQARFENLSRELREWIKTGAYRSRSAEIYSKFKATGRAYLGAVTFLGATAPAVKGLAFDPVMFKSGEQPQIAIDAATMGLAETLTEGENMDTEAVAVSLWEKIKGYFNTEITLKDEERNKVELSEQVKDLTAKLAAAEATNTALVAERDAVKARLAEFEKDAKEAQNKAALSEFGGKLDAAVTAGKLLPAEKDHWVKLAEAHPEQAAEYLGMIEGRGASVLFQELTPAPKPGDKPAVTGRSAAFRNIPAGEDEEDNKERLAACDLMDADEKLTFAEAVKRVRSAR